MRCRRIISLILAAVVSIGALGCGKQEGEIVAGFISAETAENLSTAQISAEDLFKDSDYYEDYTDGATRITFEGDRVTVSGGGVTTDSNLVTINAGGQYVLSGDYDGHIEIDAGEKDKVYLYLNGVKVNSGNGPALYETSADKVIVSLVEGSSNSFSDGTEYAQKYEDVTACMFFKDSVTVNGTGSLCVYGNSNDGITSKDVIKIMEGSINITSVDDGIVGKDKFIYNDGELTVVSKGHGIKTTNEEKGEAIILGGSINITSDADGINAVTSVAVNGGNININAGDDGIHADVSATVNGGTVNIVDSYEGIESLTVTVNGGYININAQDDGINATAGSSETDQPEGFWGNKNFRGDGSTGDMNRDFGGKEGRPDRNGENGGNMQMPGGDRPEMPNGEIPEMPNGEMPEMPNGEMPVMPGNNMENRNGEFPSFAQNTNANNEGSGEVPAIIINGGIVLVSAKGDGIDSNGYIEINGGKIVVEGPEDDSNGALDSDRGITMNDGFLVAMGSSGMYESISADSKLSVLNCIFESVLSSGTEIQVTDGDTVIYETVTTKKTGSLLVSSSLIEEGHEYKVYAGDDIITVKGEAGGSYSGFNGFGHGGFNKPVQREK